MSTDIGADAYYMPIVRNMGEAITELTRERDRARDIAAALEAQVAAVEALRMKWRAEVDRIDAASPSWDAGAEMLLDCCLDVFMALHSEATDD